MHPPIFLVFTAVTRRSDAERLAHRLVDEKLAACATVLPAASSIYFWEGERKVEEEYAILFKTAGPALAALEERMIELHPYECPEFLAVQAERVSEPYGAWVARSVEAPIQPV